MKEVKLGRKRMFWKRRKKEEDICMLELMEEKIEDWGKGLDFEKERRNIKDEDIEGKERNEIGRI